LVSLRIEARDCVFQTKLAKAIGVNQWQLILSGFAYTLFDRLRVHLKNTPFERMSAGNWHVIKKAAVPGDYEKFRLGASSHSCRSPMWRA